MMEILGVLLVGALRIVQANLNKQTSAVMRTSQMMYRYSIYFEYAAAFCSFLYLFVAGLYGLNMATLACASAMGVGFVFEFLTAIENMKRAPLVLCNICALGGGVIVPSVVGALFYDDPMPILKWVGVVLFFVSVFLLSPPENAKQRKGGIITYLLLFANFAINGFCGVVNQVFSKSVENGNPAMFTGLSYAVAGTVFVLIVLGGKLRRGKSGAGEAVPPIPRRMFLIGGLLGAGCATIVYISTILIRLVPIVIVNTVPSIISIVGCFLMGCLIFKEKVTVRNLFGVLVGIATAILIV